MHISILKIIKVQNLSNDIPCKCWNKVHIYKFCRTNNPPLELKTDLIELGLMDLQRFAPPRGLKEGRVLFAVGLKGVKL